MAKAPKPAHEETTSPGRKRVRPSGSLANWLVVRMRGTMILGPLEILGNIYNDLYRGIAGGTEENRRPRERNDQQRDSMLLTILGALLGVIFSILASAFADLLRHRDRHRVFGRWISSWQPNPDRDQEWIIETVNISFNWFSIGKYKGRLRFVNSRNSHGFHWVGYGDIVGRRDIIGVWRSVKPASHSSGGFVFAISTQGTYLCGYCIGPGDTDRTLLDAWVLGRTEKDLEAARQHLWLCRLKKLQPPPRLPDEAKK